MDDDEEVDEEDDVLHGRRRSTCGGEAEERVKNLYPHRPHIKGMACWEY